MVKKVCFWGCLFLFFACPARAAVTEVELYPNQARVEETAVLQAGKKQLSVELSGHVRANTIRVHYPQGEIISLSTDLRSASMPDRLAALKEKLQKLKSKKDAIQSQVNSLEGEISYFRSTEPAPESGLQAVLSLGEAVRKQLRTAYDQLFEHKRVQGDIEEEIKEVEQELDQASGSREEKLVLDLVVDRPASRDSDVYLSYVVDNCGWRSEYRLNGDPAGKAVDFTWKAGVWQNTGVDWSNASLSLATSRPFWQLQPPQIGEWTIAPARKGKVGKEGRDADRNLAAMALTQAAQDEPLQEKKEFRTVYSLGDMNLKAGEEKSVKLRHESWPAEFDYLIRPYRAQAAFVRARVEFDSAVRLPSGKATYFLDSAYVGEGPLKISTEEKELFFGPDEQIQVEYMNVDSMSGESGFFSKKDSHSWKWRVSVKNSKSGPAAIVIQDIMPKIGDEDIELEKTFDPRPDSVEDRLLTWRLDIDPGAEKKVVYGCEVVYPSDMSVDLGR
ncbi:MAG: DUF4139 domain-containing protein [Desulfonatronovibrionaceae bacterium]